MGCIFSNDKENKDLKLKQDNNLSQVSTDQSQQNRLDNSEILSISSRNNDVADLLEESFKKFQKKLYKKKIKQNNQKKYIKEFN